MNIFAKVIRKVKGFLEKARPAPKVEPIVTPKTAPKVAPEKPWWWSVPPKGPLEGKVVKKPTPTPTPALPEVTPETPWWLKPAMRFLRKAKREGSYKIEFRGIPSDEDYAQIAKEINTLPKGYIVQPFLVISDRQIPGEKIYWLKTPVTAKELKLQMETHLKNYLEYETYGEYEEVVGVAWNIRPPGRVQKRRKRGMRK